MLSTEERIAVVSARLRGFTYQEVQADFERKFRKPGPTRANIRLLMQKFQRTGSVQDVRRSGRPQISDQTVQQVSDAVTRSLKASTRRLSRELGIPQSTVWKILHFTLKKRAYHLQIRHALEHEDYACREAMCYDLLRAVQEANLLQNVLFSDEATFHTCGMVNRHNCRVWADEQPNEIMEWERNTPKVNVWLGLTKSKVYGPFFFGERTVTGNSYIDMLQQFLQPQLQEDGILETVVFQQDGAPPHFALIVREYLDATFPRRWIGRGSNRIWAPRSPDLTPLDFFAWGYVKSQVYKVKINSIANLKERIRQAVRNITPAMLNKVFEATVRRWETCMEVQGGHIE